MISKDGVTRTATGENATGVGDGPVVIGASVGVSFSAGVSWDKDQCLGTGKSIGLSLPGFGIDLMSTDDGRVHGVQASVGPGKGLDFHVLKQWTISWTPEQLRGESAVKQDPRPVFQLPEISVTVPKIQDIAQTQVLDRFLVSPPSLETGRHLSPSDSSPEKE